MKCPTCVDAVLVMTERQGIEIDYCPACRGVWLDRGELDKLIERSALATPSSPPVAPPLARREQAQTREYRSDYRDSDDGYGSRKHHRKSWLSEIFD